MSEAFQAAFGCGEPSLSWKKRGWRCLSALWSVMLMRCCSIAGSHPPLPPDSDLWPTAPFFIYLFFWRPVWAVSGPGLSKGRWLRATERPRKREKLLKQQHLCADSTDSNTDPDRIKAHHKSDAAWFQVHTFICMNKNAEPGQTRQRRGIDSCLWCITRPADKDLSPG